MSAVLVGAALAGVLILSGGHPVGWLLLAVPALIAWREADR